MEKMTQIHEISQGKNPDNQIFIISSSRQSRLEKESGFFLLSYLACSQIWLNHVMDDHDFSYIHKLHHVQFKSFETLNVPEKDLPLKWIVCITKCNKLSPISLPCQTQMAMVEGTSQQLLRLNVVLCSKMVDVVTKHWKNIALFYLVGDNLGVNLVPWPSYQIH